MTPTGLLKHFTKLCMSPPVCESLALLPTSPQELSRISKLLKETHSSGVDVCAIVAASNVLVEPLTELIDLSLETGIFREEF